ncbi:MAG: DNA cytosine methyltransferase [Pseudomonadota bacterium]
MAKKRTDDTVIDLFSGVGGLSLGAARAGFRVVASVELDAIAAKSHKDNFPGTAHLETDVGKLSGETLLEAAKLRVGDLGGLIGGPPCQGFSMIGRREQADPRNDLFVQFFRLVAETRPAFYLAENVPGILNGGQEIMARAFDKLPKNYVRLEPMRIEAQRYGAPTTRTRIFFVGYDPDRIRALTELDFAPDPGIKEVRVKDALKGLGQVRADWQAEEQSWRRAELLGKSEFAKRVVGKVPKGVGNAIALERLKAAQEVSGFLGTRHSAETIARFDALAEGEVDKVYRSPRLKLDGFCPTLRAGTSREKGSYQAVRPIHPKSPRVISPREAARLQGFPDWFVFNPTKWHSFRQIGNSVSPIVAEQLMKVLKIRGTLASTMGTVCNT